MFKNKLLHSYVKLAASRYQTNTAHKSDQRQQQNVNRFNEVGIQMINEDLRKLLFGQKNPSDLKLVKMAQAGLRAKGLFNKDRGSSHLKDIDLESLKLPALKGANIEQHFNNISRHQTNQYLKLMSQFVQNGLPRMPKRFDFSPGWTKYDAKNNTVTRVEYPDDHVLVFDVETLVLHNMCPVIAVCVSNTAWYSWCSERLITNNFTNVGPDLNDMIPLEGSDVSQRIKKKRVVIGHNVGFDRSFVKEQYFKEKSGLRFMDTMSMHIASSGFSHDQRSSVLNKDSEDPYSDPDPNGRVSHSWRQAGSLNNLADVYKHYVHVGEPLDKDTRNIFVKGSPQDVIDNFQELVKYCANDVRATFEVFSELMPIFIERFPSPVTLSGMLEMSTMYMPINQNWFKYISSCENTFNDCDYELKKLLERSAYDACRYVKHKDSDVWLKDLDWSTVQLKAKTINKKIKHLDIMSNPLFKISDNKTKSHIKENVELQKCSSERVDKLLDPSQHTIAKNMYMCNYPKWFRELCPTPTEEQPWQPVPAEVTTRIRVMPNLLRLTWNNKPLYFLKDHGWGYYEPIPPTLDDGKKSTKGKRRKKEKEPIDTQEIDGKLCQFVKIPHKDGEKMNVGNPLSKSFLGKIQEGVLGSIPAEFAKLAVKNHNIISYWSNNLKRIQSQKAMIIEKKNDECLGAILPTTIVAGTITRRAVEPTWLTATNYSKDRIGCELKTMIQSPPGYNIVGADVDSQELWIAATIGDAHFAKIPGSTALGWMNLEGKKSDGTDMHSKTASIIGISRDHAKVFNYGRIYGAGVKFAMKLLMQFNPSLTEQDAQIKAKALYEETKGKKVNKEWTGGTESEMFNKLEEIAKESCPSTPVLNARITKALEPANVSEGYMTSRINWVVQSSAVDYLHLMLCCMDWLIEEYKIDARFLLSIHDEVRYLVKEEDKYRLALALQITNLFTRVMFSYKLQLQDLPLSVAFFSAVDIDTCLRKEPDLDFVCPSNPNGLSKGYNIPPGKCVDIYQIIEKTSGSLE